MLDTILNDPVPRWACRAHLCQGEISFLKAARPRNLARERSCAKRCAKERREVCFKESTTTRIGF